MTLVELVQTIGARRGFDVSEREAEFILWEHTGYPAFFAGPRRNHWVLRSQIRAFFRQNHSGQIGANE